MIHTEWKVPNYGVFSCPNTGKYGPEETPYLDTFHAVTQFSDMVLPSHVVIWDCSEVVLALYILNL